ncbi:hypothetical protein [Pseudomonas entomophila]|uniref:hypothetical protein n=1 Tax=Pseudomonas entomophila TaxID=312306 RepID=UPI001F006954|nr:hypothetical protein [Pseudomonas entomophila]MCG8295136.1 hypothetical protein [Pseudomonas entomophila]
MTVRCDAFALLAGFLKAGQITRAATLGLPDFAADTLATAGFDLVGECNDFHFWERTFWLMHCQRHVQLGYKRYFQASQDLGDGFDFAPGIRLTSVIRRCLAGRALQVYFWDDWREGAVIVDEGFVIRFNLKCRRGAYQVCTLECDLPSFGVTGRVSTNGVRATLHACNPVALPVPRHAPVAYRHLRRALLQRSS